MNKYKVTVVWDDGASVKNNANTGGNALHVFKKGETFFASEIVSDSIDPNNINKAWAKVSEGAYVNKYVAVSYPSVSRGNLRCTWEEVSNEPEPETPSTGVVYPDFILVGPEDKRKKYIPEG